MLTACWSAKGGVGTTVVAAGLALLLARSHPGGALLVDLAGDAPAALGVGGAPTVGITDWLTRDGAPADGFARLELAACPQLALLPRGSGGAAAPGTVDVAVDLLTNDHRPGVVDCGVLGHDGPVRTGDAGRELAAAVAASAGRSLLVLRPCYLALRRAVAAPLRPSGVVLVAEPDRALSAADVEQVLGVPVVTILRLDAAIARAVDAGLLAARLPRTLERGLRDAA